jgi:hypothetical protein
MNKFTLSLGLAIAATIMLMVPIGLSGNAKASTCSFSRSAAHGSFSEHQSFSSTGSCSAGAATGQVFGTEGAGVNSKSTCITIFANHGTASGQFGEVNSGGVSCPHP